VKKTLKKIFQFLYGPIFAVLDFFMRNYRANRKRLENMMSRKKVSFLFQSATIVLLVAWILIFIFASDENRNTLTQEITKSFGELKSFTKNTPTIDR